MWTETTRRKYDRRGCRYASDLTDEEFALIQPHVPEEKTLGRPRTTALRGHLAHPLDVTPANPEWAVLESQHPDYAAHVLCNLARIRRGVIRTAGLLFCVLSGRPANGSFE